MTRNEIAEVRKDFSLKRDAKYIKLNHFIVLDGDYYERKDFNIPKNVIVEGNIISFDVENWTTYKSQTVTVNLRDVAVIWY